MMSSSVAMEILCITNIGSISSKKIAGVEKIAVKMSDCNIFYLNFEEIFEMYWKISDNVQISKITENK